MSDILGDITGLSAAQIDQILNIPGQIESLVNNARRQLESVQSGQTEGNPVSDLFSTLSNLLTSSENIPDLGGISGGISDILQNLPSGQIADITSITSSIEEVLEFFGPLREALLSGDFETLFQQAVDRGIDFATGIGQGGDLAQITDELGTFFRLFRMLVGWGSSPPPVSDIVELLSQALIGVSPDILAGPRNALQQALAPLDNLLPESSDLTVWRNANTELETLWQQITIQTSSAGDIQWANLETNLLNLQDRMLEITAIRDRLLSSNLVSVNSLNLERLGEVSIAVMALPRIQPVQINPILDGIRSHLRGIVEEFTDWAPTEEEAQQTARSVADFFFEGIENSSLGQLRRQLILFQQRLLYAIETLPLRDLASEAEAFLRKLADAVDVFDPDAIRKPIRDFFSDIRTQIDQNLPQETIRNAVQSLWDQVEAVLNEVNTQIGTLRSTIEGAVSQLESYLEQAQSSLEGISNLVTNIKGSLESFDLSEPAQVVIDELKKLEEVLASLDLSVLPDAAVSLVEQGLNALRDIEIAAEIQDPINDVLELIDPTPLLEQAASVIGSVTDELKKLDPSSLAKELDKPVDQLLTALTNFGPGRLRELLLSAIEPLKDALWEIDAGVLLGPLNNLYAELKAKVDSFLDPDVIFQPLEELYQPIIDLIDDVNPARLVELLEPSAGQAASNVGSVAGPTSVISDQNGILRNSLDTDLDIDDELFGLRPGDLLTPLIDLHKKLVEAIDTLEDSLLEPAAAQLQNALVGTLRDLSPTAILQKVQSAFDAVRAEFHPPSISVRFNSTALAFSESVRNIGVAAQIDLSAGDRAIADRIVASISELDPLNLIPANSQVESVFAAQRRIESSEAFVQLRVSFAAKVPNFEAIFPTFLNAERFGAAELRQALNELDPSPMRDEINDLFDQVGERIVGLQSAFQASLNELALRAEEFLMPVSPTHIIDLAQRLHAALKEQVIAFGPATYKDEVQMIFDVVKNQLSVLDPSFLAEELNSLRDEIIEGLDELVDALIPDLTTFNELQVQLASLKPSQLLSSLTETLKPLTEFLSLLDPSTAIEPLVEVIARIRLQIPDVLHDIEEALDAVLDAFPGGGASNVSGSASVSVS